MASCGVGECVREAVRRVPWKEPRSSSKGKRRGYGLAAAVHSTGSRSGGPATAGAFIKMNRDGSAQLFSGTIEMGTGTNTVLAQICAETLGVPVKNVRVVNGDTAGDPLRAGTARQSDHHHRGRGDTPGCPEGRARSFSGERRSSSSATLPASTRARGGSSSRERPGVG